jgi:arylsulfatase A
MHRVITTIAVLVFAITLPSLCIGADAPQNVVLIMADDIGFECFSSYGSDEYSTPRLDALAAEGIRFENCHSTPLCTPSRVNIMTGKSNVFNYADFGVYPQGEPTFAHHFKEQGYATAVAGKWQLLTANNGISATEAGFDTYCVWNTPMTARERYWNPSLECNGKILELPEDSFGPEIATSFLIDFIEEKKGVPFLAYYPMILPHNPFIPTPDSESRGNKNAKENFIDMVAYLDVCVGRIVDALEANGLRENTLVIFTGDNGTNSQLASELFGDTIRGGKGYTHDYGTHVPLIVNCPGTIPAGLLDADLVCFSDFFPTIVDATGLPPKEIADGDGMSFWSRCQGREGVARQWIYGYYFPRPYANRFDDKYAHWEVRYARDCRYKLYANGDLFDTIKDVMETSPLEQGEMDHPSDQSRRILQEAIDAYPESGENVDFGRVTVSPPTATTGGRSAR